MEALASDRLASHFCHWDRRSLTGDPRPTRDSRLAQKQTLEHARLQDLRELEGAWSSDFDLRLTFNSFPLKLNRIFANRFYNISLLPFANTDRLAVFHEHLFNVSTKVDSPFSGIFVVLDSFRLGRVKLLVANPSAIHFSNRQDVKRDAMPDVGPVPIAYKFVFGRFVFRRFFILCTSGQRNYQASEMQGKTSSN